MSEPHLQKQFEIRVEVAPPVLVGQDNISGRRQLIPILSGTLTGSTDGTLREKLSGIPAVIRVRIL